MIAIDTNILLKYLLYDDIVQSEKASKIILGKEKILVTDIVLVEAVWTLKGKRYKLDKQGIIQTINRLFEEPNIIFEDGQTIWKALGDYSKAKPIKVNGKLKEADFPDALIINKAQYDANRKGQKLKCVYTFDKAALEIKCSKQPE